MAIQTDRARPADAGTGGVLGALSNVAGRMGGVKETARRIAGYVRVFSRRIGLYEFLTYGPLIRLVAKTLLRRIIFANLIGLVVLLSGIFYWGQYHAWLIKAKRDSLQAQGEVIAAAIAANATREKDTGRIVLNPDMLPEIDGDRSLLRDENIAAMQLSIPPDRVAPLFKGKLMPADIRARVYASDGVLIVDFDQLLARGQLSDSDPADADSQQPSQKGVKTGWTRFMSWLMRRQVPVYREIGVGNGMAYPEVRVALTGGHDTAMVLINDKGEQIVSVATPIQYRGVVQGALLLSTRPGVIDDILQEERTLHPELGADGPGGNPHRLPASLSHHRRSHAQAFRGRRQRQPKHRRPRQDPRSRWTDGRGGPDGERLPRDDQFAVPAHRSERTLCPGSGSRAEKSAHCGALHGRIAGLRQDSGNARGTGAPDPG